MSRRSRCKEEEQEDLLKIASQVDHELIQELYELIRDCSDSSLDNLDHPDIQKAKDKLKGKLYKPRANKDCVALDVYRSTVPIRFKGKNSASARKLWLYTLTGLWLEDVHIKSTCNTTDCVLTSHFLYVPKDAGNRRKKRKQDHSAERAKYFGCHSDGSFPTKVEGDCELCGNPATDRDHRQPLSFSGSNNRANYRPLCRACNRAEYERFVKGWPKIKFTALSILGV